MKSIAIFEINEIALRNKYVLTVFPDRTYFVSTLGWNACLSIIAGDKGAIMQARLIELAQRDASPQELRACIMQHIRHYISGPQAGECWYEVIGGEDASPSMESKIQALADALKLICFARDFNSLHGRYPNAGEADAPGTLEAFDDWAADVAQKALMFSGIPILQLEE